MSAINNFVCNICGPQLVAIPPQNESARKAWDALRRLMKAVERLDVNTCAGWAFIALTENERLNGLQRTTKVLYVASRYFRLTFDIEGKKIRLRATVPTAVEHKTEGTA